MNNEHHHCRKGLSLLEVLAVAVILGIIAVIVVPRATQHVGATSVATDVQYRARINTAIEHMRRGAVRGKCILWF